MSVRGSSEPTILGRWRRPPTCSSTRNERRAPPLRRAALLQRRAGAVQSGCGDPSDRAGRDGVGRKLGWATAADIPPVPDVGALRALLDAELSMWLINLELQIEGFGSLSSHDDSECHFSAPSRGPLLALLNRLAAPAHTGRIAAASLAGPGRYIACSPDGEIPRYSSFDDWLERGEPGPAHEERAELEGARRTGRVRLLAARRGAVAQLVSVQLLARPHTSRPADKTPERPRLGHRQGARLRGAVLGLADADCAGSRPEIEAPDAPPPLRALALLAEIARRKTRIVEDFYDIGVALAEIKKKKLYRALAPSFEELLRKRRVLGATQTRKLLHIVGSMSREDAVALGFERAFAAVRYTEATPALDSPRSLVEGKDLVAGKHVLDTSVREVERATTAVRDALGKQSPVDAATREARRVAREVQASLRKRGARGATAAPVRRGGVFWIHVEVPIGEAGALSAR